MTTQLTWAPEVDERRPVSAPGGRGPRERAWRSHTFADGVRSLTLVGTLDVAAAGRLWARVAQLLERGCRRLIVDARALPPVGDQPVLLAGVLADQPASCEAVVVAPPGSALRDLLPASVSVTRSLSDARVRLEHDAARHDAAGDRDPARVGALRSDARGRPAARSGSGARRTGPAGRIPTDERHALAIRQSLRWATRSAREGDYERALEWLALVERTEGALPEVWTRRREAWLTAWKEQARQRPDPPTWRT